MLYCLLLKKKNGSYWLTKCSSPKYHSNLEFATTAIKETDMTESIR